MLSKTSGVPLFLLLSSGWLGELNCQQQYHPADHALHPVRQELIDEIKAKTTKWKPREVKDNHFGNMSAK